MKIKEVIVVEGRDDYERVKDALDCECVITHGYGFNEDLLNNLYEINKKKGIIVFTDPDYAGKNIRRKILDKIPDAKQAYLPRNKAFKGKDIGIENAKKEDIIEAIKKAKPQYEEYVKEYDISDMIFYGLLGDSSKDRRIFVCDELSIGYSNGKRLVEKLNSFKISREVLEKAILKYEEEKDG